MEDDLKILKVEYLTNHWLDFPQILNLSLWWPPIEDDLKISKVEYLSKHWLDLHQISNWSSEDQTEIQNTLNEDDLKWKTTSNGRRPQNIKSWIYQ